jgi:hypothetical protein
LPAVEERICVNRFAHLSVREGTRADKHHKRGQESELHGSASHFFGNRPLAGGGACATRRFFTEYSLGLCGLPPH